MEKLIPVLASLVPAIPSMIVDGVLLAVAVSRWNRHPRVSMLAAASGGLMLMLDVMGRVFFTFLPMRMHESGGSAVQFGWVYAIVGSVSGLLHAVAIGLLVGAVFAERGGVSPERGPASSWGR